MKMIECLISTVGTFWGIGDIFLESPCKNLYIEGL
jgi:hypothetical protein